MKAVRNFSRILIAPVFIFSGFVKAIDPLGSTYKFTDYFEAFGLDFLSPIALGLAVVLSTAELVIGLNLLMGILSRFTSWALLIFMSFFTILTLFSALTNPVTDCGCFGDALILSNWQTFWKNTFFMVPTLIIFYGQKKFRPICSFAAESGIFIIFLLVGLILSIYTYRNLPVIDFRPYKIGTHIPTAMDIPDDAEVDEYETLFIYEKEGVEQEFAVENIPYTDTAWKYVDRKTTLLKKGYEPPIHDFTIANYDGLDITDSVLNNSNYTFLVVAYNLDNAKASGLDKINELAKIAKETGINVYGMTSSTSEKVNELNQSWNFTYDYHTTDEITLKTIVRSNPGLLLLKDGVIVNKWHYNNLPKADKLENSILSVALEYQQKVKNRTTIGFYLLLLVSLFSVLALIVKVGD